MVKKITIATVCLYILGHIMAQASTDDCLGWDCDAVYCPSGYAVEVEDGSFLPCDRFDDYLKTKNKELLK